VELSTLNRTNCLRIHTVATLFAHLSTKYTKTVEKSWVDRLALAKQMCNMTAHQTLDVAAATALAAWGDVMMQGRECCNVAGPPFCVVPVERRVEHAVILILCAGVFMLVRFSAHICKRSVEMPHLVRLSDVTPEVVNGRNAVLQHGLSNHTRGPPTSEKLSSELMGIFRESSLSVLPEADTWAVPAISLFAGLQGRVGFQADSAKSQFEHLLSLWRSQCAMVADRTFDVQVARDVDSQDLLVDETGLLRSGLAELHMELLDGFRHYREKLQAHLECASPSTMAGPPFATFWEAPLEHPTELAELAAFLLVWGEAGNVRFMPELVYFIADLLLSADTAGRGSLFQANLTRSSAFLACVIRPLHNRIFDETYEQVTVHPVNGKDVKDIHRGFEKFMPADCANYDDWNELFCDPERLTQAIVLDDGTKLFDLPVGDRFVALERVDWVRSLRGAKTHREIHSLWGLFAAIHRVVFLHTLLFLLTLVAVVPTRTEISDVLLAGNTARVRLSAVGLLVPLHAACWKLSAWFTAGSAVRRSGRRAYAVCKSAVLGILYSLPLATYILVRYVDVASGTVLHHSSADVTIYVVVAVHLFVSTVGALVILCAPTITDRSLWQLTPASCRTTALRWLFWVLLLALKASLSFSGVSALNRAMDELMICRLGQQSIKQLPIYAFGPHWDKDMIKWLLLISTGFLQYITDTQFWFSLGCSILGIVVTFHQRRWHLWSFFQEDSVAKIPERFSVKVLHYSKTTQTAFPILWDKVVEHMRYEDKIDDYMAAHLSYNASRRELDWTAVQQPLAQSMDSRQHVRLTRPQIFTPSSSGDRILTRSLGLIPDQNWPQNTDVQWRLLALARGLALDLPRPFRAPYIPGVTVLIPHYGEAILVQKRDLYKDRLNDDEVVPLMSWIEYRYAEEFKAFTSRMSHLNPSWTRAGAKWSDYSPEDWNKLSLWASMRGQTLWRTVAGMILYHEALECHFQLQGDKACSMGRSDVWKVSEILTCMISMQMYAFFDAVQLKHTNLMLEKFPRSLQIAFIDCEEKGEGAKEDGVHDRQARRYFSCLIDKDCPMDGAGRRQPRLRVELPGFPILGDGKGDNQNHAIPFTRGMFIQAIDANQGAYFEQMLLLPCVLGEFRSSPQAGQASSRKIVGFPEHITSDIGTIGDFAAGAESAFGTILQRSYAALGGRMHYGHPDMMNKVFMIQQGGVSKATKTVNLSEDIFAGLDFTLRGNGRTIQHSEYFHVSKGRDLGFGTVLLFFSKLSAGTGEQMLTRQMARLSEHMGLPEALTLYYAHGGFYLTQFLLSKGIPVLVFVWLFVILDDAEYNFDAFGMSTLAMNASVSSTIARLLISQFGWIMILFLVAGMAPLLLETVLQAGLPAAISRGLKQLLTLSPLHFIFQAKIISWYVSNEILYGGASYVSTGRGLPTERRCFIGVKAGSTGLYNDYAPYAFYDGAKLLVAMGLAVLVGGLHVEPALSHGLSWWCLVVALTVISWLFAPFIFNPYQFSSHKFREDLRDWAEFFLSHPEPWRQWYEKTQLKRGSGIRSSPCAVLAWMIFLATWYTALVDKVHLLGVVFPDKTSGFVVEAIVLLPPIFLSGMLCAAVALVLQCKGRSDTRLVFVSCAAASLTVVEAAAALSHLVVVGWTKSAVAGLIYKFSVLSMLLDLCECFFRLQGPPARGCFPKLLVASIDLWLHAHRMMRDVLTSGLILIGLAPIVLLGLISSTCCSCRFSLHNLLVYRDPGHPSHVSEEIHSSSLVDRSIFLGRRLRGWRSRAYSMSAAATQRQLDAELALRDQTPQLNKSLSRSWPSAGQAAVPVQQTLRQAPAAEEYRAFDTAAGVVGISQATAAPCGSSADVEVEPVVPASE